MKDFKEKWQNDQKFKVKIKLSLYVIFIVIVTIYAASLNSTSGNSSNVKNESDNISPSVPTNIINLSSEYTYTATIKIDDIIYKYTIAKTNEITNIIKEYQDIVENYQYTNNNYYKMQDNAEYVLTTSEEVWQNINSTYIDINTINTYLNKAKKENNQYIIYLKDIILGNTTNEYFIILVNSNKISIDYTPLVKQFNNNINNYEVNITILEGLKNNN